MTWGGWCVMRLDPDDLRRNAAALEKRIEEGKPGRILARRMTVGRSITSGAVPVPVETLVITRTTSAKHADSEQLLSVDMLQQHGYQLIDNQLIGPSSWPGGAPGDAPAWHDDGASPGAAGESGGGSISLGEAHRQIKVSRDYADWAAEVRREDIWSLAQERRSLFFGVVLLDVWLSEASSREWVRGKVEQGRDAVEIELWSEKELRRDHSPAALGEG